MILLAARDFTSCKLILRVPLSGGGLGAARLSADECRVIRNQLEHARGLFVCQPGDVHLALLRTVVVGLVDLLAEHRPQTLTQQCAHRSVVVGVDVDPELRVNADHGDEVARVILFVGVPVESDLVQVVAREVTDDELFRHRIRVQDDTDLAVAAVGVFVQVDGVCTEHVVSLSVCNPGLSRTDYNYSIFIELSQFGSRLRCLLTISVIILFTYFKCSEAITAKITTV